ncbi:TIGR03618 family F420-dependent PPOX class oxidoreductase [Actinoplanes sp. CA-131856]
MRQLPLSAEATDILRGPNPAVLSLLRPDGAPFTTATWYLLEGERTILVNNQSNRVRLRHMRKDPRVALTVLAEDWYTHVSLIGRVVGIADDPELADIDRIARHYTKRPFEDRETPRSSVHIEIEQWHAWGALRPAD